ncbi:hypothetical protein TcWFU_010373 [Taenia crassiceps]|uniref:Uncharacterized protein n=1 Tax=Taenia crassiceps TaxID=6207 RepID=A0ABR4Q4Q1_9CEST
MSNEEWQWQEGSQATITLGCPPSPPRPIRPSLVASHPPLFLSSLPPSLPPSLQASIHAVVHCSSSYSNRHSDKKKKKKRRKEKEKERKRPSLFIWIAPTSWLNAFCQLPEAKTITAPAARCR